MSKSYRDRRAYELHHHHKVCTRLTRVAQYRWVDSWCVCRTWDDYRMRNWPVPSWFNRNTRQAERTSLRRVMVLGLNGHKDWDDLPAAQGRVYRRPYYW